jgi:hypothetical protein
VRRSWRPAGVLALAVSAVVDPGAVLLFWVVRNLPFEALLAA